MKTINLKSALTSGLIAGIIINISAISMVPAVGNEMNDVLVNRGLPPLSNMSMVFFSFVSITLGVLLAFLYSLLKLHITSKIKTAIISALIVWFIAYYLSNASLVAYGSCLLNLLLLAQFGA